MNTDRTTAARTGYGLSDDKSMLTTECFGLGFKVS